MMGFGDAFEGSSLTGQMTKPAIRDLKDLSKCVWKIVANFGRSFAVCTRHSITGLMPDFGLGC